MAHKQPIAVFIIGPPGSGKSTITQVSLVDKLGFTLIDVDVPFEVMLKEFDLSPNIIPDTPEQKELRKKKNEAIDYLISIGYLPRKLKMYEYENPYDYLDGQEPTTNRVTVVAREITKRLKEDAICRLKNIAIVETGGQAGRIKNDKKRLEDLGYKTAIIYVCPLPFGTFDEIYQDNLAIIIDRNDQRAAAGGRKLDKAILETSFKKILECRGPLMATFDDSIEISSLLDVSHITNCTIIPFINQLSE